MRIWFVTFMLGWALAGLALLLVLFSGLALLLNEPWLPFLTGAVVAFLPALPLLFRSRRFRSEPSRRGSLLAVLLLWLLVPVFAAVPWLAGGFLGPLDALFEAMSGFTTTGASVIANLQLIPESFLLYRSLSQWLGGIGIIVVFAAVFPQLGVAGRQLFMGEEPGPREDRLAPRLRHAALALLAVYAALTVLSMLSYWLAGMEPLHAVSYAFATLSAGGFETTAAATAPSSQPVFAFIFILFMLLAGTNLTLQYRAFSGHWNELIRDVEFRTYLLVIAVGTLLLLLVLGGGSITGVLLQVVSVITTAGFTVSGLADWPQAAQLLLVTMMFIGGSAGSAAGGIRIMRWLIMLQSAGKEVQRLLHPRAALPLRIGHRLITGDVLRSTTTFFVLYVVIVVVSAGGLLLLGLDPVASFSAAMSTVGLTGFGFTADGQLLDFAALGAAAKAILIFDMYAGRLEIVTLAVLLVPGFWQLPRQTALSRDNSATRN